MTFCAAALIVQKGAAGVPVPLLVHVGLLRSTESVDDDVTTWLTGGLVLDANVPVAAYPAVMA